MLLGKNLKQVFEYNNGYIENSNKHFQAWQIRDFKCKQ